MDQETLERFLSDLPMGWVKYLETVGSTNNFASRWVKEGALDFSLVVANEQTAGKGRLGRKWVTLPDSALAFSLILKNPFPEQSVPNAFIPRITGLGALAVCTAIQKDYQLPVNIKWSNDLLIDGHKISGILAEARWRGDELTAIILGIGINITSDSIPQGYSLNYPAGALEQYTGCSVDRLQLLVSVLREIIHWRALLQENVFIDAWERNLAYKNEWVGVFQGNGHNDVPIYEGRILGLNPDGALRLGLRDGKEKSVYAGDIRIRPVDMLLK